MKRLIPFIAVGALAGCGNERTRPPDVSQPSQPKGRSVPVRAAAAGVAFRAPRNWRIANGLNPPLVSTIVSGSATVAVWRYERAETLPKSKADLAQARKDLLATIKDRDPRAKITRSRVTTHHGDDAILVLGTERIAGRLRQVRSLHVFAEKGEVVVDAYAPPAVFSSLDRSVFVPVIASLRVTAPKTKKTA